MRFIALAIVGAAALLALTGCTATAAPSTPPPSVRATAAAGHLVVPLPAPDPLAAYEVSAADRNTVSSAIDLLTDDCLRGFGFTPPTHKTPVSPTETFVLDATLGYAHFSPAEQAFQQQADAFNAELAANPPSAAYLLVQSGGGNWTVGQPAPRTQQSYGGKPIPPGGCQGQANATVIGGDPYTTPLREMGGDAALTKNLEEKAANAAAADPATAGLDASWSACMAKQGFDYSTPAEARNGQKNGTLPDGTPLPPSSNWNPRLPATPTELSTAKADATCQLSLHYQDGLAAIRAKYQRQLIDQNQLALDQIKQAVDAEVRHAADVVGGAH